MRPAVAVFFLALAPSVIVAAQDECPLAPPPACRASAFTSGEPDADGLLEELAEAAARSAQERRGQTTTPSARRGRRSSQSRLDDFVRLSLSEPLAAFVDAGRRFVCLFPAHPEVVVVRYRIARVHYENNQFPEAAAMFRAIAMEHPSHPLAEYAASLYLDSLNVMATRMSEPRAGCVTAIRGAVEPLSRLFCATRVSAEQHPDLCQVLSHIQDDALR